jgi:hypothetical protein
MEVEAKRRVRWSPPTQALVGRPPPPPPSSRRHLHGDLELHLLVSSRVVPSLQIVAGRICVGVMRAAAVAACGGSRQEEGH